MPILDKWDLSITTDEVLRAQGANPELIWLNRPALVQSTVEAITIGISTIHPIVLYEQYRVKGLTHERLELEVRSSDTMNAHLSGKLIAQHLASAESIILILCTIGSELDDTVSSLFRIDPLKGLALDGVGSASVECLAIQACNFFEAQAKADGLKTTMPLNPGMVGWPLDQGQLQVFSLLDSEQIHVSLTESCMMIPSKSLSMVLGVGTEVSQSGSSCDYCSLKDVCKYQNHYDK